MDKLALLHPSLGLAFTAEFTPRGDLFDKHFGTSLFATNSPDTLPLHLLQGNKAADNLPSGCDGCKEDLSGNVQCCLEFGR